MSPTAVAAGPSSLGFVVPFACPFAAGAAATAPAPPSSNTTSTPCTCTISPTLPRVSVIVPAFGAVIVTVALSVITSTIGWSSTTTSPGFTSQLTTSPSVTPSPMSGSLNSQRAIASSP